MAMLTPAAPRLRSSDGTFSKAGELTANLIRKAYGALRGRPRMFSRRGRVVEFGIVGVSRALAAMKKQVPNVPLYRSLKEDGNGYFTEAESNPDRYADANAARALHKNGLGFLSDVERQDLDPRASKVVVGKGSDTRLPAFVAMHEYGHALDRGNLVANRRRSDARFASLAGHVARTRRDDVILGLRDRAGQHRDRLQAEVRANQNAMAALKKYAAPEDVKAYGANTRTPQRSYRASAVHDLNRSYDYLTNGSQYFRARGLYNSKMQALRGMVPGTPDAGKATDALLRAESALKRNYIKVTKATLRANPWLRQSASRLFSRRDRLIRLWARAAVIEFRTR